MIWAAGLGIHSEKYTIDPAFQQTFGGDFSGRAAGLPPDAFGSPLRDCGTLYENRAGSLIDKGFRRDIMTAFRRNKDAGGAGNG